MNPQKSRTLSFASTEARALHSTTAATTAAPTSPNPTANEQFRRWAAEAGAQAAWFRALKLALNASLAGRRYQHLGMAQHCSHVRHAGVQAPKVTQAEFSDGLRGYAALEGISSLETFVVLPRSAALVLNPRHPCPSGLVGEEYWEAAPW